MGGFQDQIEELFAPVHGVSFRRMFGGIGIFKETLMFALVIDDVLHFKVGDATKAAFTAEGYGPWTSEGKKGTVVMPYWQVPERLLDEPDEFADWARKAFAVARDNRERKTAGKSKPKKAAMAKAAPKPKPKKKTAPKRR